MKLFSGLMVLGLALGLSAAAQGSEMRLKNGATIDVEQDTRSPRQRLSLIFQGGNGIFKPEMQGVAPILLNILDQGPARLTSVAYNKELFLLGAEVSYGSNSRALFVTITAKPEKLEKAVDLVLETIKSPKFDDETYALARGKVEAAVAQRDDDMRSTLRYFAMRDAYKYHPDVLDGSTSQLALKNIDIKKVKEALPKLFDPEYLIFGSVGPEVPEKLRSVVEHKMSEGGLLAKAYRHRNYKSARADEKPSGKYRLTLVNRPGATDNQVLYLTRRNLPVDNQDMASLEVANALLGGMSNSALYKTLREQRGLTYGVGSGTNPNIGLFTIASFASTDKLTQLVQGIQEVVDKQAKTMISKEETELVKGKILSAWKERRELPADRLNEAIVAKLYGRDLDFVSNFDSAISKTSESDVTKSGQRYFSLKNANVYMMGDKEKVLPLLKSLGYKEKDVRIVEPSQIL